MEVCILTSLNPPPKEDEGIGHRLLALVRSIEKDDNDNENNNALTDLLQKLVSLYSRKGLLQGNIEEAQRVLESSSSLSSRGGGNQKRNRNNDAPSAQQQDDTSLVLSALIRVLTPKERTACWTMNVALAAETISIICTHIQDNPVSTCARAEVEILSKSSRSLLAGLGATLKTFISREKENPQVTLAIVACLQATTSVIAVLGQKVSRPSTLQEIAWTALNSVDARVCQSSALLLSVLPLTGVNNTAPADAWSTSVADVVASLNAMLHAMAPSLRQSKNAPNTNSTATQSTISDWISHATKLENEQERVEYLQHCLEGLTCYLVALLTRQAYAETTTRVVMMTARLPIQSILNLCEGMVLLPSAAEAVYVSTKKRLRMEVVENGLLSPSSLVTEMANPIKYFGHSILDGTMSATGFSLLPFARQVIRIAESSLLASTSTTLQKVLDPTRSALPLDGNRKQWLQNSIVLRTRAIKTYGLAIQTLGASVLASSLAGNKSHNETHAVSCIAGSLLEQLEWPQETNDDWATFSERVDLCVAALDTLSTMLTTGGGYLPLSCRSLIDSIALTCFASVGAQANNPLMTCSSAKVSMLKLGSGCLCTPWPDGASSSILSDFEQAVKTCTKDRDNSVAAEATACLQRCTALSMTRVPALSVVTSREIASDTQSAFSLVQGLKTVREEAIVSETVVVKPSRPLEESTNNEQKDTKRQKVDWADDTTVNTNVVSKDAAKEPSKSIAHPPPTPFSRVDGKVQQETMEVEAKPQSDVKVASAPIKESQPTVAVAPHTSRHQSLESPKAKTFSHREKEDLSLKKPAPMAQALPKKAPDEDSDDGDFFPEIVLDGGPDDGDRH